MVNSPAKSAQERKAEVINHAHSIGIDNDYISILVDEFYGRARKDEVLGPIFNQAIGDNWEKHMSKIKLFWQSVALNAGTYSGKPVVEHAKHKSIQPEHFTIWLSLFEETLSDTAPTEDAKDYFLERAQKIAMSLQWAIFGPPPLKKKSSSSSQD